MSQNSEQVKSSIELINQSNLDPQVVKREGAGKAYQAVSQSMALAVQDATEYQRNLMALAQAAIGVSAEGMVKAAAEENASKIALYQQVIQNVQTDIVAKAIENFGKIGTKAGDILNDFPSGS